MPTREDRVLRGSPLFTGLDESERAALLRCLAPKRLCLRRGEALWHAGDTVRECAVVLSGQLRAESVSAAGERTVCALHGAGSLAGDVLMVSDGRPSPVDVFAAADTEVLLFSGHTVLNGCPNCCARHEKLRHNLLAEITEKYWSQRERLGLLEIRSLRGRLAALLAERAEREGADTFSLAMTREDLAGFLCANRSALSRELSRMRAEGLIDFRRDRFTVRNADALERYR